MRLIENESRLVGMKFEMLVELSPKRSGAGLDTFDIPGAKRRGMANSESQVSQTQYSEICWTNYPVCKAHRDIPEATRKGIETPMSMESRFCL